MADLSFWQIALAVICINIGRELYAALRRWMTGNPCWPHERHSHPCCMKPARERERRHA